MFTLERKDEPVVGEGWIFTIGVITLILPKGPINRGKRVDIYSWKFLLKTLWKVTGLNTKRQNILSVYTLRETRGLSFGSKIGFIISKVSNRIIYEPLTRWLN